MTDINIDDAPVEDLIERLHGSQLSTMGLSMGYQTTMTFSVCVTVKYRTDDGTHVEHFWSLEEAEEAAHRWREERRKAWETN